MGMPVSVELADSTATSDDVNAVYAYFTYVDETFSTYKETSEISKINRGELKVEEASIDMREVFTLSEKTKKETKGFFDIQKPDGSYDPSGLVKGWAIFNAAKLLKDQGLKNFYIDAGGDIEAVGRNDEGKLWTVGIQDPFSKAPQVVKVLAVTGVGVATSGNYIRGEHIYNPHKNMKEEGGKKKEDGNKSEIVSLTVIGPNIYEADRFATAAFAMGRSGIQFIESLHGFEGYMIDNKGIATMTSNFNNYVQHA